MALLGLTATGVQAGYYPGYGQRGWYPPPVYQAPPAYYQPRTYRPAYPYPVPQYRPAPYGHAPGYAPARLAPPAKPAAKAPAEKAPAAAPKAPVKKAATTQPKKQANTNKMEFLETVLPLVRQANEELRRDRHRLLTLDDRLEAGERLPEGDRHWLADLADRFRVKGDPATDAKARETLKRRVDVIPADLALAQAAHESAWGRSRFAREANNLFGVWTYDASQGLKPKRRESGKKHFVRVFDTLGESVRYYLHTLNTHSAYRSLRALREKLRDRHKPLRGELLAGGLTRYSGRAEAYVSDIKTLIRQNDLTRYNRVELAEVDAAREG